MATVILFNTTNSETAHVHDETCPLVAAARKSRGLTCVIPHTEANAHDMTERGWQIAQCKCVSKQGVTNV